MKTFKHFEITPALLDYVIAHNPKENKHLQNLREETDKLKFFYLRSPVEQVTLLTFLVQYVFPQTILEIGTFTGYTTLALALATSDNTRITTCDLNNVFPSIGKPYWINANINHRIDLKLGPALNTLQEMLSSNKRFDFVYIDADKENNLEYLRLSLQLLNKNGLIIVDNTLRQGKVTDSHTADKQTLAIKNFNARLHHWPDIHYCLIPFCDGITLICKTR